MNARSRRSIGFLLALVLGVAAVAQRGGRRRVQTDTERIDRGDVPTWPVNPHFPHDHFTFARLKYRSTGRERTSFAWFTDYPDADLNLSFRLQQLTSLKVNPDPKVIEITDPQLPDYPWVFMSGAGHIDLNTAEARILRNYLLSGGFLMVDDFWGQSEWEAVAQAMQQVFPDRPPVDLPRSHPLFHGVYDLPESLSLQTPNVGSAVANRETGITWEDQHAGGNTREPHFRAILDDQGRIMVLLCHNTDNGDGWEEEATDPWFFSTFSEKKNYPLGINILFHAMTH